MKLDYVLSPFYPIANNLDTSHRAGWARYWADATGAKVLTTKTMDPHDIEPGARIGIYHGMEFKGQMNLQSGLTDKIVYWAGALGWLTSRKQRCKLFSLDIPMPDYGSLLAERGLGSEDAEALTKLCKKAGRALVPHRKPVHLVVGDSHALSQYSGNRSVIYRADGQTMWGAIQTGLKTYLDEWLWSQDVETEHLEALTFYFGNIDIRHHLMRFDDPKKEALGLVKEYVRQVAEIDLAAIGNEIVLPLPIEDESRQIPKSGWYKGEPFYGTWAERDELRRYIAQRMKAEAKKHGVNVVGHPEHFTKNGQLDFEVMEKPRSVHIRPSEYAVAQDGAVGWKN